MTRQPQPGDEGGDPLDAVRDHREAVEALAEAEAEGSEDDLDAAARVLLAYADGEQPAQADKAVLGLPRHEGGSGYGHALSAPVTGQSTRPSPEQMRRLAQQVLRRVKQR
jgi:hypothetical protein